MGIDINSKLMLVPTNQRALFARIKAEADELFDGDIIGAAIELGLDYASPWFDAAPTDCDFGVEVPSPTYDDLIDPESKWFDSIHNAQNLICELLEEVDVDTKLDSFQNVY